MPYTQVCLRNPLESLPEPTDGLTGPNRHEDDKNGVDRPDPSRPRNFGFGSGPSHCMLLPRKSLRVGCATGFGWRSPQVVPRVSSCIASRTLASSPLEKLAMTCRQCYQLCFRRPAEVDSVGKERTHTHTDTPPVNMFSDRRCQCFKSGVSVFFRLFLPSTRRHERHRPPSMLHAVQAIPSPSRRPNDGSMWAKAGKVSRRFLSLPVTRTSSQFEEEKGTETKA